MKARRLKEFEKELRARRMEIERAEIDLLSTMAVSQAVKVIRREVLTVMNAVLLQLERIDGGITFSCIEQTRQQAAPRKYERGIAPSRSTVQLAQKQINIAGQTTVLQDTKRSDDMCAFSLRRVLCELLALSKWPGHQVSGNSSAVDVSALPALEIDGTADGAKLSHTQGMIIQGVKVWRQRGICGNGFITGFSLLLLRLLLLLAIRLLVNLMSDTKDLRHTLPKNHVLVDEPLIMNNVNVCHVDFARVEDDGLACIQDQFRYTQQHMLERGVIQGCVNVLSD